jgi:hypothetical protein
MLASQPRAHKLRAQIREPRSSKTAAVTSLESRQRHFRRPRSIRLGWRRRGSQGPEQVLVESCRAP